MDKPLSRAKELVDAKRREVELAAAEMTGEDRIANFGRAFGLAEAAILIEKAASLAKSRSAS